MTACESSVDANLIAARNQSPIGRGFEKRGKNVDPESSIEKETYGVLVPLLEGIPETLRACDQWVDWQLELRDEKWTKVPYDASFRDHLASTTDPNTWSLFDDAVQGYRDQKRSGIGFVFTAEDPYAGVDLDCCRDPATGEIKPWALEIIQLLNSYTEVSPSGTGVKIFLNAKKPCTPRCRVPVEDGHIEIYDHARYFTVTGHHLDNTPPTVERRDEQLATLCRQVFPPHRNAGGGNGRTANDPTRSLSDEEVIERVTLAADGKKYDELWLGDHSAYPSHSEGDLALCGRLATLCGRNPEQIDSVFRRSGLMRPKWDVKHHSDGRTYGEGTIEKALEGKSDSFNPCADAEERVKEIIETLGESSSVQEVFAPDNLTAFAVLSLDVWQQIKPRLKEIFGKELNLNHVEKAVAERRREQRRRHIVAADDRPVIVVNNRPLSEISADALKALAKANQPPHIFVRSGGLARVDHDECQRPIIREMFDGHLRHELARAAYCVKQNDSGQHHISPPMDLVVDIRSAPSWSFPCLDGIAEAPVVRPDGTILMTSGYDEATRLYYEPAAGLNVPPIPTSPTRAEVEIAVRFVSDLIVDFPFDSDASRANMLAGMLTPIVRPLIPGCVPLLVIDAPAQGTGKTLLADVAALIATGRTPDLMTAPRDDEEFGKRITAVLSEGATIINIDNIDRRLSSSTLSAALTTELWSHRRLGTTENIKVRQRATWVATGNNVQLGGDMARRCYRVRVDPKMPRPWIRTDFTNPDLRRYVREHRSDLLAALLTIARAWIAAGRPPPGVKPIGSFEDWTIVLGGMLEFAKVPGFLGNLSALYEEMDEEAAQWTAFLSECHRRYSETPVSAAQLSADLRDGSNLASFLPDDLAEARCAFPATFQNRLGKALAKRAGTRFGDEGLRIERAGKRQRAVLWRIHADEISTE